MIFLKYKTNIKYYETNNDKNISCFAIFSSDLC